MGHMKFKQAEKTTTINILFVVRSERLKSKFHEFIFRFVEVNRIYSMFRLRQQLHKERTMIRLRNGYQCRISAQIVRK